MSVVVPNHTDHRNTFISMNGKGSLRSGCSNGESRPQGNGFDQNHQKEDEELGQPESYGEHERPFPNGSGNKRSGLRRDSAVSEQSMASQGSDVLLQQEHDIESHSIPTSSREHVQVPRDSDGNSEGKLEGKGGNKPVDDEDYKIEIRASEDTKHQDSEEKEIEPGSYASQEKNRMMQEQATRRAAINKEQQNILMMMEKEDAFWKKQEDRFKLMVKRQSLARRTSDELLQFINKWNKVMVNLAQGYRNLTQYGREETGTLRQACIAQGILSKSMADHFSEMRDRIFTDTGKEAADLTKNMFANTKQLEASGKRLSKVIKTARSKCMDSWVAYAKAVQERQRLEIANKPVSRDPFVACRLYDRDVASLRKQEMQYRKEMTRLFRDFKVEDGRRIDKTQSIMLDYLLAQKAMLEDGIKFTESAIEAVKGIDREADVDEFIRQADLIVPPSDAKGKRPAAIAADNVFEVQPPHRDPKTLSRLYAQECQCQGPLYRQSKFLKSSWKKAHIVLSRSGFFHQFESKNAVQPEISICLRDCHVNLAPKEDQCAFEIVEPSRGFFSVVGGSTRHYYKADSEEELVDWMIAIKKHIPESKIEINDSTQDEH
mmetsp:Transcript_18848/g.35569  ORF Transcript_18848/g.35569 Transcript_18848/m.35569 type:complete len:603 (-) Transcript_18848:130-1938(-)